MNNNQSNNPPSPDRELERLVDLLIEARRDVHQLAADESISPRELAEAVDRRVVDAIRRLAAVSDAQAQVVLGRYRAWAVTRLAELASDENVKPDIARRACVDLLRHNFDALTSAGTDAAPAHDADGDLGEFATHMLERIEKIVRDGPTARPT